ncbi:MAG: carbohydrate kinase family protein [Patescibacteria group bacterium]
MIEKENKIEMLAIGDIVIDSFIKLKQADISGAPDTPSYKICLPYGEKVPYEEVYTIPAVGNAANASVSVSRLGLISAIVSNLGDDVNGKDCLRVLEAEGVRTGLIKINPGIKTNYHFVLWYPPERTILIKHEKYNYSLPDFGEPGWIYFSSVSENAFPFHDVVAEYLNARPNIKLAFQPGKNEIKLGKEKLAKLYQRAEIFFCNVEEAKKILGQEDAPVSELLKKMRELGPKKVVITDGPKGSYSYDGNESLFMPPYPDPKPPFERTGAGDAFSSTVVAALISGETLARALAWGGINAMSVVQEVGAQKGLLSREKLEEYLRKAPAEYKAKRI